MIIDELVALLGYKIEGEQDLKKFTKDMDGLQKKAEAVGRALGRFAALTGAAVAAATGMLGKSVIDQAAQFEQFETSLVTIEGTQEKAKAAMKWIADFAKKTPYELDGVTEAFIKLKAYGIDPTSGVLMTLGDTASAMGKDLDQAVEAFADASTGEFERLKEFGIKASSAGEKVTFTWQQNGKEMTKTVKKNATEIQKFLRETWGKKFDGAMIRQSKTWKGMMSNLTDSWGDFQRRIADAGFFDAMKARLGDVMDTIGRMDTDGTLDKFAKSLSDGLTKMVNAFAIIIRQIGHHIGFISKHFEKLKPFITAVAIALGAMVAIASPWITAVAAMAVVLDDFLTYMEGGESVIGKVVAALQKFYAELKAAGDPVKFFQDKLSGIADQLISDFPAAMARAWETIKASIGGTFILPDSILSGFRDSLFAKWEATDWTSLGTAIGEGIRKGLESYAQRIRDWFANLIPGLSNVPGLFGKPDAKSTGSLINRGAPGAPGSGVPSLPVPDLKGHFDGNMKKTSAPTNNTVVNNDHSQDNRQFPVSVSAPVTVNVTQSVEAPGAVGAAVAGAVNKGVQAQPARMQASPAL